MLSSIKGKREKETGQMGKDFVSQPASFIGVLQNNLASNFLLEFNPAGHQNTET